jgi:hypothetical protein
MYFFQLHFALSDSQELRNGLNQEVTNSLCDIEVKQDGDFHGLP